MPKHVQNKKNKIINKDKENDRNFPACLLLFGNRHPHYI